MARLDAGYLPSPSQTVIYEANLRTFAPGHAFAELRARLPVIHSLGVNVIWLMPIQPVGKLRSAGGLGSPYAVADYDAVNPEFGNFADFRRLVAEAHRLRMALIIDWVANHTAWDHPWITAHPDWYVHGADGKISIPKGTNWNDVAQLDYTKPVVWTAMTDAMRSWISRYDIDGFRCDTADWVRADFWKQAVTALRSTSKRPILMLAEGYRADHYDSGFDLTYAWHFYDRLVDIFKGGKALSLAGAVADEARGVPASARRLRFTSNHDKSAWEGTALDFFHSPDGERTAFLLAACYGGTPLIYEGQEVEWSKRIPLFDDSKIDWGTGADARTWMTTLLQLRREHSALREGQVTDLSTDDVVAFSRRGTGEEAIVLANVRGRGATLDVPALAELGWREAFSGEVARHSASVVLPPYGRRVYIRQSATR